jgi:hypothetical protein
MCEALQIDAKQELVVAHGALLVANLAESVRLKFMIHNVTCHEKPIQPYPDVNAPASLASGSGMP